MPLRDRRGPVPSCRRGNRSLSGSRPAGGLPLPRAAAPATGGVRHRLQIWFAFTVAEQRFLQSVGGDEFGERSGAPLMTEQFLNEI